jgi:hypothetical protein
MCLPDGLIAGGRERREIGLRIWDLRGDSVGPKPREFSLEAKSAHSNRIAGGKIPPPSFHHGRPDLVEGSARRMGGGAKRSIGRVDSQPSI